MHSFEVNIILMNNEESNKSSVKKIVLVIILIIIGGVISVLYFVNEKTTTYNKFCELYNTIIQGSAEAETTNNLICNVWHNAILNIDDEKTDKYTKDENGKFYENFNDALDSLYRDQAFISKIENIYNQQSYAKNLIQDLLKHSKSFDEEYRDFKECYNLFLKFTDMSISPNGSLKTFSESYNELDEKIADKIKELNIYFYQ